MRARRPTRCHPLFVAIPIAWTAACTVACNLEDALNAEAADGSGSGSETGQPSGDGGTVASAGTTGPQGTDGPQPGDSTGGANVECSGYGVRVSTHNVRSIGAVGSDGFDALVSTLGRISPDVACFQEVQYEEHQALVALAEQAGYENALQAYRSPAIGGDHTNACVARVPLTLVGSWGAEELSSDPGANDTGRDFLVVRATLGETEESGCWLGVIAVHLKSLEDDVDLFRRQVEVERLRQAISRYWGMYPSDPIVVMGDFNENIDDPAIGQSFSSVPPGLPSSYRLGSDIQLPLPYQPFASLQSEGLELADPTQEDSDRDQTWNDEVRLDYLWFGGGTLVADEIYNSCRDDGVDDGGSADKSGAPLECGVSTLVSDHFAVFADLEL